MNRFVLGSLSVASIAAIKIFNADDVNELMGFDHDVYFAHEFSELERIYNSYGQLTSAPSDSNWGMLVEKMNQYEPHYSDYTTLNKECYDKKYEIYKESKDSYDINWDECNNFDVASYNAAENKWIEIWNIIPKYVPEW
jgi:hypothetical protein